MQVSLFPHAFRSKRLREQERLGDRRFDQSGRNAVAGALNPDVPELTQALKLQEQVLARATTDHRHYPVDIVKPPLLAGHQEILAPAMGVRGAIDIGNLHPMIADRGDDRIRAELDPLDGGAPVKQRTVACLDVGSDQREGSDDLDAAALLGKVLRRSRRLPMPVIVDQEDTPFDLEIAGHGLIGRDYKGLFETGNRRQNLAAQGARSPSVILIAARKIGFRSRRHDDYVRAEVAQHLRSRGRVAVYLNAMFQDHCFEIARDLDNRMMFGLLRRMDDLTTEHRVPLDQGNAVATTDGSFGDLETRGPAADDHHMPARGRGCEKALVDFPLSPGSRIVHAADCLFLTYLEDTGGDA